MRYKKKVSNFIYKYKNKDKYFSLENNNKMNFYKFRHSIDASLTNIVKPLFQPQKINDSK